MRDGRSVWFLLKKKKMSDATAEKNLLILSPVALNEGKGAVRIFMFVEFEH